MQPKGINDVFNAPELSLIDIRNELGVVGVRAALSIMISDVVCFFNVGKTMNDTQVATTCDLLIDIFPYFKLEDFKLCFKFAMSAKYGPVYDRLDGSVIIEWLKKYDSERTEQSIVHSDSEQKLIEHELNNSNMYQDYLDNLKERADSGDEEASKCMQNHLEIESFIKSSGVKNYLKERDKQRLNGRGIEYEKQFNRNLK